jgi:hypothetical protein
MCIEHGGETDLDHRCQQSFKTWREWMDHDLSVHTVSSSAEEHDSAARSCPFGCRVLRHAAGEGWYRHVGHHMEDIRLLALPPSLRLPNDDFEGGVSGSSSNGLENPLEPFHMGGVSMIIEEESERSESVALDDGELKAQSQDNSSPWHDMSTPKIECGWKCGYSSPRESNVKQHMEKAHGYAYVQTRPRGFKRS